MTPSTRQETSAGGVLVRRVQGRLEVCLILRSRHGRAWGLPKGHPEGGEDAAAAAVREVREETGVTGAILEPLGTITYQFRPPPAGLITKTVSFFLMGVVSGQTAAHDAEVVEVRWMPLNEAILAAAYENERQVLQRAKDLLARQDVAARLGG